ncbi:hypothetical protein BDP27DRAFT_1328572 [Rhodocollybia butyracea]|uniref:Uncharacterized protein n=1 Tax=Rhodocollybia butyracea TaxID=206335 RepID=A0A9P5PS84_9AGAR|nr:hypothetical protein BDP27DRAFT_1328572 [Rhodocollybia butyracea]
MAKSPKKRTTKKPARASASVSFADDDEFRDEDSDVIMEDEGSESDSTDLSKFMEEIQKRQAKKSSKLSVEFENQKKTLYASARAQAREMSREGVAYLENLKPTLLDMRKDETTFEKYFTQIAPSFKNQEDVIDSLYQVYPSGEDLFLRRAQTIDNSKGMLRKNPAKREKALRQFLENARQEVDRSRQNEIEATDASRYIKHLKGLLLS